VEYVINEREELTGLGNVDDGSAHQRTEDTAVGDSKGTTGHILDSQLVIASLING
jgi:hypothetical protein